MLKSIPLVFNDKAYHDPIDGVLLCLPYTIAPCGKAQRRFRDRLFAEPRLKLEEYEFRAVFDWIEISVETKRDHVASNFQRQLMALNRRFEAFRTCFVTSPTRGVAHSGRGFVIKMQDPAPAGLFGLLRVLLHECCVPGYALDEIPVTGVELSLDVYPAPRFCQDEADYAIRRMLMTEVLRKHVGVNEAYWEGGRRPRFVFQDGTRRTTQKLIAPSGSLIRALRKTSREKGAKLHDVASCEPAAHHQPYMDATFYFGQKGERLHYRQMDKVTDNRVGDDADVLPLQKTRSRVEFTLIDQTPGDGLGPTAVGINSVEGLALDGLKSFNQMWLFDLPTFRRAEEDPDVPETGAWEIFAKTGVGGLARRDDAIDRIEDDREVQRAKARQEVLSSGKQLRFSAFNRRVTKALQRLEDRWRRDLG